MVRHVGAVLLKIRYLLSLIGNAAINRQSLFVKLVIKLVVQRLSNNTIAQVVLHIHQTLSWIIKYTIVSAIKVVSAVLQAKTVHAVSVSPLQLLLPQNAKLWLLQF